MAENAPTMTTPDEALTVQSRLHYALLLILLDSSRILALEAT